jgi:hypothetical protein
MIVNRIWLWLSLTATVLMAVARAAGIFLPGTYARETPSWAAQAVGQNAANLFVVVPAMFIAMHFVNRGPARATLVWLGLLIYVVYSYILYAFFIHFGAWFLVYVAALGLSAYALFSSLIHADLNETRFLAANPKRKLAPVVLLVLALLFTAHWLSEIVPALLSGTIPRGVAEIGALVSPVHVLDLAFILPGMIVTATSVRRNNPLGLLFAVPLLTFSAVMGIAILCMFAVGRAHGTAVPAVAIRMISGVVVVSVYTASGFLRLRP